MECFHFRYHFVINKSKAKIKKKKKVLKLKHTDQELLSTDDKLTVSHRSSSSFNIHVSRFNLHLLRLFLTKDYLSYIKKLSNFKKPQLCHSLIYAIPTVKFIVLFKDLFKVLLCHEYIQSSNISTS